MSPHEFARMLHGRQRRQEITHEEARLAWSHGLVVVHGHSDDRMELDGYIEDEFVCYGGGLAYIGRSGVHQQPCLDTRCAGQPEELARLPSIEALWCQEPGVSWSYRTDVAHATFDVMDAHGDVFCRGIVFSIHDLAFERTAAAQPSDTCRSSSVADVLDSHSSSSSSSSRSGAGETFGFNGLCPDDLQRDSKDGFHPEVIEAMKHWQPGSGLPQDLPGLPWDDRSDSPDSLVGSPAVDAMRRRARDAAQARVQPDYSKEGDPAAFEKGGIKGAGEQDQWFELRDWRWNLQTGALEGLPGRPSPARAAAVMDHAGSIQTDCEPSKSRRLQP